MISSPVVVLDFETTGLYPRAGDRITEVAALRVTSNGVVDRYVSLANAGCRISSFITGLTGITNEMIATAPPVGRVVRDLAHFIGSDVVVAHNAGFDHRFLSAECGRIGINRGFEVLCTVRLARRLVPGLFNYKLPTVAAHLGVEYSGRAHRAEADAQVAAEVLLQLTTNLADEYSVSAIDPCLLQRISRWPVREVKPKLRRALTSGVSRPLKQPDVRRTISRRKASVEAIDPARKTGSQPSSGEPTWIPPATSFDRRGEGGTYDPSDLPPLGVSWWMDRDGDLHDRVNGCLYQRRLNGYTIVDVPAPGVLVKDAERGQVFIEGRAIYGFAGRVSHPGQPSSVRGVRPWMLDRESSALIHRASGVILRENEFEYVHRGANGKGFSTTHPLYDWIPAADVYDPHQNR